MYDDNNIFARILRGEIPCKKVYEDDHTLAFEDINPEAPVHTLVIPNTPRSRISPPKPATAKSAHSSGPSIKSRNSRA